MPLNNVRWTKSSRMLPKIAIRLRSCFFKGVAAKGQRMKLSGMQS